MICADYGACGQIRVNWPAQLLQSININVLNTRTLYAGFPIDAIFIQRCAEQPIFDILKACKINGTKIILDFDDLLFKGYNEGLPSYNRARFAIDIDKTPADGDGGKVLTVVEPGGQTAPYYEWKKPEPAGDVHYNLYKNYDYYDSRNTSKQEVVFLSQSAYNVRGWVSVKPDNGGASIMPLSAGQTDISTYTGSWDKVSNNINNYNLPSNSYTFIPFAWTADYPIVAIGIKGNGNVSIGHAFVETIK